MEGCAGKYIDAAAVKLMHKLCGELEQWMCQLCGELVLIWLSAQTVLGASMLNFEIEHTGIVGEHLIQM